VRAAWVVNLCGQLHAGQLTMRLDDTRARTFCADQALAYARTGPAPEILELWCHHGVVLSQRVVAPANAPVSWPAGQRNLYFNLPAIAGWLATAVAHALIILASVMMGADSTEVGASLFQKAALMGPRPASGAEFRVIDATSAARPASPTAPLHKHGPTAH
jgi:hypothetical protein